MRFKITVRFSSREPHRCLLFKNTNSTVPLYADEFVFLKYTYLLSKSPQRVEFLDTLRLPLTRELSKQSFD